MEVGQRPNWGCSAKGKKVSLYVYKYSRHSDWLRAGRPRGRSASPGRGEILLFSSSRPVQELTQPPIQWILGVLLQG
jgi:hypothetical protein